MNLTNWLDDQPHHLDELKNIFFESSSRQNFSSNEEKELFFESWTAFYFENYPKECLLALEDGKLSAYLTGCSNSEHCFAELGDKIPTLSLFADQFGKYQAHLHINTSPKFIGLGIGSKLIGAYIDYLKSYTKVSGVHVVTSPLSKNRAFYNKNGFVVEIERTWKNKTPLLFMGRSLV